LNNRSSLYQFLPKQVAFSTGEYNFSIAQRYLLKKQLRNSYRYVLLNSVITYLGQSSFIRIDCCNRNPKPAVYDSLRNKYESNPMSESNSPYSNRSVSVGRDVTGSVIQTGDGNTASVTFQQAALPQPESVDMTAVLTALENILSQIESPDRRKIENAVDDAKEELKKPDPNKDEVGTGTRSRPWLCAEGEWLC
jgi:hypothetical protein